MIRIEFDTLTARIVAPPAVMSVVRWHVAYQEVELPPVRVQLAIRGHFSDPNTIKVGGFADVAAVKCVPAVLEAMAESEYDPDDLTVGVLESTLAQRNAWDGWKSMVNAEGYFPSGLVGHVERALKLWCGIDQWEVVDRRGPRPEPQGGYRVPELFPFQREAVERFLAAGRGVMDLPPRSGKTRIALAIVATIGRPTLYVAPTIGIVRQTVRAFRQFLPESEVMAATGGRQSDRAVRKLHRALVWVGTPLTVAKIPGVGGREVLIMDEFHHAAAASWQAVSRATPNAWWRLGLTGTHYRADGRDMEMAAVLGQTVYRRTVQDMVGLRRIVPAKIAMLRIRGNQRIREWYAEGVVDHADRNRIITWAASLLMQWGKRVLILGKEKEHTKAIAAAIPGAVQVDGDDNDAADVALAQLAAGKIRVVVGTSVIGEGRDVPAADALVYAAGGKSKVKVVQDYFRVLTASPGKTHGIVVDMADAHHHVLLEHAVERLAIYRGEGAFSSQVMDWWEFEGWLAQHAR